MITETAQPTVLIGLLGESPNDTRSLRVLLEKRYGAQLRFAVISPDITGAQLDSPKLQKVVLTNYRFQKPDVVVVSRDLDAPITDRSKRLERLQFFRKLNKGFERKGVYLLNVQAIEALIAADIQPFDKRYRCTCAVPADPTTIDNPVKFLKDATTRCHEQYDEGHCADLLAQADYSKLLAACAFFATFDRDFTKHLQALV